MKEIRQSKNELPPGIALAWDRVSVPRRGPRPGHTLDEIVRKAIGLADRDGILALSLPKIAASLGLTRNALYRYVKSKDEMLRLIHDAAWGVPPKFRLSGKGWRKETRTWALAVIHGYRRHPWLLDVPITGPPSTPNVLRWLEALLEIISCSGLNAKDCLQFALLLDGYAHSVARLSRDISAGGQTRKQWTAVNAFLLPLLRQRNYPILASILTPSQYASEGSTIDYAEFGLDRILDSLDQLIASQKP